MVGEGDCSSRAGWADGAEIGGMGVVDVVLTLDGGDLGVWCGGSDVA